jgi:uncharacterized tellurite resistance protein B-like protein
MTLLPPTAARLICTASTRQLNDVLDDEGRRRVVKMMWEVAYVDESMNEVASNMSGALQTC